MSSSGKPSKTTNHPEIQINYDPAAPDTHQSSIDAAKATSAQSRCATALQEEKAQKKITAHVEKFQAAWDLITNEAFVRVLHLLRQKEYTSSFKAKEVFGEVYEASRGLFDDSYILTEHLSEKDKAAEMMHATSLRNKEYNRLRSDQYENPWSVYDVYEKGFSSLLEECRKSDGTMKEKEWEWMKAKLTKESLNGKVLSQTLTGLSSIQIKEKLPLLRCLGLNLSWTIGELDTGVPEGYRTKSEKAERDAARSG